MLNDKMSADEFENAEEKEVIIPQENVDQMIIDYLEQRPELNLKDGDYIDKENVYITNL